MANGKKNGNGSSNLPALLAGDEYAIVKASPAEVKEIMASNIGDEGVQPFSLDRVSMPAGGGKAWTVPTLEGEVAREVIRGVIICWQDVRVFYAAAYTGEHTPPDCSSEDGIVGVGEPGGQCRVCPNAQFGTSTNADGSPGAGQACSQCRRLFMLQPDDLLPLLVTLPPTSLGAGRKYFQRLASRAIPYYGVVTDLGLEVDKNATGVKYSKALITVAEVMEPDQRERFRQLKEMFEPWLRTVGIEAEDRGEDAAGD